MRLPKVDRKNANMGNVLNSLMMAETPIPGGKVNGSFGLDDGGNQREVALSRDNSRTGRLTSLALSGS